MAIGRINATLSGVQPGGLAKIVPTSVAVGSGSGSSDANGTVTFSGCTSVSLNGVFSSLYRHYKILTSFTSTLQTDILIRLRVSNSDNGSANYYTVKDGWSYNNGSVGYGPNALSTFFLAGNCNSAGQSSSAINLFDPFTTNNTSMVSQYQGRVDGASVFSGGTNGGQMSVTTSYDSFTLLPGTGNITGNITIYGYN